MNPKIFPIAMCILSGVSSIVYLYQKDIPRCVYWISAMTITLSTLFMK